MNWISVKEKLPKLSTPPYSRSDYVLTYDSEKNIRIKWLVFWEKNAHLIKDIYTEKDSYAIIKEDMYVWMDSLDELNCESGDVTHWMPLPEPPKENM